MVDYVECKTASQVEKAVKNGKQARIVSMIALTMVATPDANIIVMPGAYLNITLDNSHATITTWGSSHATITTLDSSHATIETLDSSQATIETLDSSHATITTRDSSQATIETLDSSHATIETWGSKCPPPASITHIGGHQIATSATPLLRRVAENALATPDALKMDRWHCGTSHCLSGWATFLDENGAALESQMGCHSAGLVLLGRDAAALFYEQDTDKVCDWLSNFLPSEARKGDQ